MRSWSGEGQGAPKRPSGIVAPGNSHYSSKAGAARVFVCPPQPARAWPRPRRAWPRRSGLEAELGSCVGRAGRWRPRPWPASWRKGCGAGAIGSAEPAGEALRAELGRKDRAWGDQGRGGEGVEPLRCQRSPRMECPGGAGGKGPLPATMAILGPESNQIRRSPRPPPPQVPSSCAEQLSGHRGRGASGNRTSCPPSISPLPKGVGCKGTGKGFGLQAETWVSPSPCWARLASPWSFSHIPPRVSPFLVYFQAQATAARASAPCPHLSEAFLAVS